MQRYNIVYELKLDNGDWVDISPIVDSRSTTIERNICTTSFKSAIDSASILIRRATSFVELASTIVDMLMSAVNTESSHLYIKISKDNEILFLGVANLDDVEISTTKIPQDLVLNCKDLSTVYLDETPANYLVYENETISEIVSNLLEDAGYVIGNINIKPEDDIVIRAFVADPDEKDTYRDYIDTLLFEAGGYVLDCNASGVMDVIRIPIGDDTNNAALIDYYISADGMVSQTSTLDTDGIQLEWSTIAETDAANPQTVYVDDISREIDDNNELTGYIMAAGAVWPEDGLNEPTYQEYKAEFLDREYQSGQKKNANKDLSLILVKNVSSSITVRDAEGIQQDPNNVFDYPTPSGFDFQTNPTIYPTKAWYLLQNNTSGNLNLTSFSLQGDCIYRDKINTMLLPESSAKPEKYESVYIYTKVQAEKIAKFYYHIKKYSRTTHTWSEMGKVALGAIVKIAHKTTEIGQAAFIVQTTTSFIGDQEKNTCIAISIGAYNEYPYKEWGISNRPTGDASIYRVTEYYLSTNEYQDVTINTPGWTTDPNYALADSGTYLWKYTKTQYTSGKIENSKPVVIAVKGDAKTIISIVTEYALSDSKTQAPDNDSDAWSSSYPVKENQDQFIWSRNKVTYSDYTFDYMNITVQQGQIIQYAWGTSSTQPPVGSFWFWDNAPMVANNKFVRKNSWSTIKPAKPDNIHTWYLWIRWSFDNGYSFTDPVCIPEATINFDIIGSDSYVGERNVVIQEQHIEYYIDKLNIPEEAECEWHIDDGAFNAGIEFSNGEQTIVSDAVTVIIPASCGWSYFVLTVSCSNIEKQKRVSMECPSSKREYLGTFEYDATQESYPKYAKGGKPLMTGDSITVVNSTEKTTDVYYYVLSDPSYWSNDMNDSVIVQDAYQIAIDSLYDVLAQAGQNNQPVENGAMWVMFKNGAFVNAFIEELFTNTIHLMGVIYGGGFNADGTKNGNLPGFHLSAAKGLLQAYGAILQDVTVNSYDGSEVLLNTVKSIPGDQIEKTFSPQWWDPADLYNALSATEGSLVINGSTMNYIKDYESTYTYKHKISTTQSNSGAKTYTINCYGPGIYTFNVSAGVILSGRVSWKISLNGVEKFSGNITSGSTYTLEVQAGDLILLYSSLYAQSASGQNEAVAEVQIACSFAKSQSGYIWISDNYVISSLDGTARKEEITSSEWNSADHLKYSSFEEMKEILSSYPMMSVISLTEGDSIKIKSDDGSSLNTYLVESFYYDLEKAVFNVTDGSSIIFYLDDYSNNNFISKDYVKNETTLSIHLKTVVGALEFGRMRPYANYSSIGDSQHKVPYFYGENITADVITGGVVYGAVFN